MQNVRPKDCSKNAKTLLEGAEETTLAQDVSRSENKGPEAAAWIFTF